MTHSNISSTTENSPIKNPNDSKVTQLHTKALSEDQLSDRIFELQCLLEAALQNVGNQDKTPQLKYFIDRMDDKLCALSEIYDGVTLTFDEMAEAAL